MVGYALLTLLPAVSLRGDEWLVTPFAFAQRTSPKKSVNLLHSPWTASPTVSPTSASSSSAPRPDNGRLISATIMRIRRNRFWARSMRSASRRAAISRTSFQPCWSNVSASPTCKLGAGMDHQALTSPIDRPAFYEKMLQYRPEKVTFASKKAASSFYGRPTKAIALGRQPAEGDFLIVFVLDFGIIRPFGTSCPHRAQPDGMTLSTAETPTNAGKP
jgi:hypothetical protein